MAHAPCHRSPAARAWQLASLLSGLLLSPAPAGAIAPAAVNSPYLYRFNTDGVLEETATPETSTSAYWWLNSGGRLLIQNGVGMTIQGDLPELDKWHKLYLAASPLDTDNGFHPQNLFRLITRSKW